MKSILKPLAAAIVVLTMSSAVLAQGVTRNLVAEAETLRAKAFEQDNQGDKNGAMNSLTECAAILSSPDYKAGNKGQMAQMVCAQLGMLQSSFFKKRDWSSAERVLRKKVELMETLKQTENNDYQGSLRMLDICLRAQGKTTETQTLRAKFKDLTPGADKAFPVNNDPPPPPKE